MISWYTEARRQLDFLMSLGSDFFVANALKPLNKDAHENCLKFLNKLKNYNLSDPFVYFNMDAGFVVNWELYGEEIEVMIIDDFEYTWVKPVRPWISGKGFNACVDAVLELHKERL